MKVVKVTSKGQVTIPVEIRSALGIGEDSYLEVVEDAGEVRLRRIASIAPLSKTDPIWELLGTGASGLSDVAEEHDRYLAAGEGERWRESS